MISAVLLSTLLIGNIITAAKPLFDTAKPTSTFKLVNITADNITVGNSTRLSLNSTARAGNLTTLLLHSPAALDNLTAFIFNSTPSVGNLTALLLKLSTAVDNRTVLLSPVVPPSINVAKRDDSDSSWDPHGSSVGNSGGDSPHGNDYGDDPECEDHRVQFNVQDPTPIRFAFSMCANIREIAFVCDYFDDMGWPRGDPLYEPCPEGYICVQDGNPFVPDGMSRAWCEPENAAAMMIAVPDSGESSTRINVRSGDRSPQNMKAVTQYWDPATGKPKAVANTTYVTTTTDHTATEIDGQIYTESKPALMGYNEGWEVLLKPAGRTGGATIITVFLSLLA